MSTLQIHLTLAALGVAVCLAFVGLVSYRHHPSFKRSLLGICAGGLVALSPFIASLTGVVGDALLPKSLLLSIAAVLSCTLFYTLSQWPLKDNSARKTASHDPNRVPVVLSVDDPQKDVENDIDDTSVSANAEPSLLPPDSTVDDFPTLELDEDADLDPIFDVSDDDLFDAPETMNIVEEGLEDTFDIDTAFANEFDAPAGSGTPDPATVSTSAANDDAIGDDADDVAIDNSMIFELTGQHEIPTDVGVPVPESDQLESDIPESDVPDSDDLELALPDEDMSDHGVLTDSLINGNTLIDGSADVDDAPGNDAIARTVELDKALQDKLDELENTLSSLDSTSFEHSDEDSVDLNDTDSSVPAIEAESFDAAESDIHTATTKLMALQRQVFEQNEQQQQIITALKERSAAQLKQQHEETSRIRELLKSTTELTREVAGQQQVLLDVVEQEKASRLKSEASAKTALGIARTAIGRLSQAKTGSPTNHASSKSD